MKFSAESGEIEALSSLEVEQKNPEISFDELENLIKGDSELEEKLNEVFNLCFKYSLSIFDVMNAVDGGDSAKAIIAGSHKRSLHTETMNAINEFAEQLKEKGYPAEPLISFGNNRSRHWRFATLAVLDWIRKNPQ